MSVIFVPFGHPSLPRRPMIEIPPPVAIPAALAAMDCIYGPPFAMYNLQSPMPGRLQAYKGKSALEHVSGLTPHDVTLWIVEGFYDSTDALYSLSGNCRYFIPLSMEW